MKKKKKTKRSQRKHAALDPKLNLKTRQHLIDYDYIDKLSEEEKDWLNKFTEEYVNASMDRKNLANNTSPELEWKQECDRLNNARKNDLYTRKFVINELDSWEEYKWKVAGEEGYERDSSEDEET